MSQIQLADGVDEGQVIQRYMDFWKFADLLESRTAYFSSILTLRAADHLEGCIPFQNYVVESGVTAALEHVVNDSLVRAFGVGEQAEALRITAEPDFPVASVETVFGRFELGGQRDIRDVIEHEARWLDVQCWHLGAEESHAMWRLYAGSNESVCIQTTIGSLARALSPEKGTQVYIDRIRYIDPSTEFTDVNHPLRHFLHKQPPFSFEQELRVIAYSTPCEIGESRETKGRRIAVDLKQIVEKVVVSPTANNDFFKLVDRHSREHLCRPAARSRIGYNPLYETEA